MKKKYAVRLLLIGILSSVMQVDAQNIAINTTGNAAAIANMLEVIQPAAAPTDYISIFAKNLSGGTNAYAIWAEATGATNKYALVVPYNSGSVGIGTTTPARLLHIRSTPSSAEFFGMRISTDHDASDPVVELYHETANKGYRWRLGAAATSSLFLDYSTNSFAAYTTYMSVISNGYMGLGTQTPQAPLHIYSAAGSDIWTTYGVNSIAGTDGLNLGYGGATWAGGGQSFLNAHSSTASNGKLRFMVNWSDKMIILDNGNIGISTTAPVVKLDLGNASSNKPVFRLHPGTATAVDYSGGYAHHDMLMGSYATGGYSQHYISFGYTADANRKFHIGSGSNPAFDGTTTFVPAFTVASGGNVGVGASSPLTKLHINTTTANDGLYLTGNPTLNLGLFTNAGPGAYNPITQTNDRSIIVLGASVDNPGGGMVIAPWRSTASGIRIDGTTGYLGVGISTPSTPLHAISYATGTASVATFESAPGAGGMNEIILNSKTGGNYKNNISFQANGVRKWSLGNDMGATGAQSFSIYDATVPATRLWIDASGYVGIGTTVPTAQLHIENLAADATFRVVRNGGSNCYITSLAGSSVIGTAGATDLDLRTSNTPGRIYIQSGGNVGIGTTTPAFKVQVSGGPVLGNGLNEVYPAVPTAAANADFLTYYFAANNWGGEGGYTNGATWFRAGAYHFWTSGVGAAPTTYATILNGDFIADNGVTLKGVSDIRYKKNIEPLENSLDKICKLRGVSYDWKDNFPEKDFFKQRQIGVIAQEVEKEFPLLVATDNQGYKSVNYMRFAPILIEAIKEQQKIIENQQSIINDQKLAITGLQADNKTLNNKFIDLESIVKSLQLKLSTEVKK